MGAHPQEQFDPQIIRLIEWKVRRLIGRHGFNSSDEEDLRQELILHVLRAMPCFDSARSGVHTYVDRIVANKITSIVGHATAQKRNRRRQQPIEDASERELWDLSSGSEQQELACEVNHALELLPADLHAVATLFMECSEAEVIRRSGLSRQKVRSMRSRIRRHLGRWGVGQK